MKINTSNDSIKNACLPEYEQKLVHSFDLPFGKCHLVIDKTILGRCWGGFRIAENLSLDEIKVLARTMTIKTILAGIPIGGAKGGVCITNKNYSTTALTEAITKFVGPYIRNNTYFMGTDIGFSETEANSVYASSGSKRRLFSGKVSVGVGCAYGILTCLEYFNKTSRLHLEGGTIALEGFGRLGTATAKLLSSRGYKIIAISNVNGMIYDPNGLDIEELINFSKVDNEKIFSLYSQNHPNSIIYPREKINSIKCDILIPGARVFTIDDTVAEKIKARVVCPLSNAPVTCQGEVILAKKGIPSVPDIISNTGGGIASVAQQLGANNVQDCISNTITRNLELVFDNLNDDQIPKVKACAIASEKLEKFANHEKTEAFKMISEWITSLGPSALLKGVKQYLSLINKG